MSVSLFPVFNPWGFFFQVCSSSVVMHWLFARCLHACVCVFRLLCLSTETLHRPPFYLHHSSSHLNPFIHPDPCASSFPFLFHSSNPYSHFLPLQRIHCLHNQHDFHWEVFSLHPWGLSPFSLSLSFSHILSWPPPLFPSSLLWYPQSDSFLWVYFYLSLTLYVSLPLSPVHAITALLWNVMIEHRQKQFEPKQGKKPRTGHRAQDIQLLFYLSFFLIYRPPFFSEGLHHTWPSVLAIWLDSLCHRVFVSVAVWLFPELVYDFTCFSTCVCGWE